MNVKVSWNNDDSMAELIMIDTGFQCYHILKRTGLYFPVRFNFQSFYCLSNAKSISVIRIISVTFMRAFQIWFDFLLLITESLNCFSESLIRFQLECIH